MRLLLFGCLVCPVAVAAEPGPTPRAVHVDQDGDILPDGAVARLGSRRFRDPGAERLYVWDSGNVVACFDDRVVRWWDFQTGHYLHGWVAPADSWQLRFSPDGRIASWSGPAGLEVWDAWNDRRIGILELRAPDLYDIAISADNRRLAAGTGKGDKTGWFQVWDIANREEVLANQSDIPVSRLAFAGTDRVIVRTFRGQAFAWDLTDNVVQWQINGCDGFQVDRRGRWLATEIGADGKLTLFNAVTGRPVPGTKSLRQHTDLTEFADLSCDGRTILLAYQSPIAWDWFQDVAANERHAHFSAETVPLPRARAFTPGGRQVVVLSESRLVAYDVATRKRLTPDPPDWGAPREPVGLAWSADGRFIFANTRSWDDAPAPMFAWDTATGRPAPVAASTAERAFRPGRLLTSDRPGPVARDAAGRWLRPNFSGTTTFDAALLAVGRPPNEPDFVDPLVPQEERLGCGLRVRPNRRVANPCVVEVSSGRPLVTLPVHHAGCLAFTPDGRRLAVRDPEGVRLFDVPNGREVLARKVPAYPCGDPDRSAALSLSFSPDGSRLAVVELGGTILVLDATVPRRIQPLADGETDRLWADLASPDPAVGWAAVFRLLDHPDDAFRLLKDRMRSIQEPQGVPRLIAQLGSDDYRTRAATSRRLSDLGDAARPAIQAALEKGAAGEQRERLATLAAALAPDRAPLPPDLRGLRALALLQRLQTPDSQALIKELATGLPMARVTGEAKQILDHLSKQDVSNPE